MIYSGTVSERRPFLQLVRLAAVIATLALALGAAACGDDEDEGSGGATTSAGGGGNSAERGFLEAMVPHHESAISMAEIGVERAEDPRIKKLAEAIRGAQAPEIEQMGSIHQRLFGTELKPNMAGHDALGLSAAEAGMDMDHDELMKTLETADPFDRAFVDEMVPHHEGAVEMAQALLKRTDDPELEKLAQAIVDAQKREIEEMNAFRTEKYGGPVPEKGEAGDEHGDDGSMEGH